MQHMIKGDIGRYVQDRPVRNDIIAKLQLLEREELNNLFESIVFKASGVFLWVGLIVDILLDGVQNSNRTGELQ